MQFYKMEPTYKKSVIENTTFKKDVDGGHQSDGGNTLWATLEVGWRWGSWLVSVPETEQEIMDFANNKMGALTEGDDRYYKSISEVYNDYCGGDATLLQQQVIELQAAFLPDVSEACNFHEVDDYDAEMIETWDGCWEDWSIRQFCQPDADGYLDEDELQAYLENVQEAWESDGYESVENLDFLDVGCEFEIQSAITLKPCDANGQVPGEEDFLEE